MIDPHVLHGGASSWLRIAANSLPLFFAGAASLSVRLKPDATTDGAETVTLASVRLKPDTTYVATRVRDEGGSATRNPPYFLETETALTADPSICAYAQPDVVPQFAHL